MCSLSMLAICCPEHARLESKCREARDILMRSREGAELGNPARLRRLSLVEEHKLADQVAMAIARLKEHIAEHGCEREG